MLHRNLIHLSAAGTALLLGACSPETATAPGVTQNTVAPRFSLAGGLYVFNSQLRSTVSTVTASGHVQLKFPNDPLRNFVPSPPPINVLISGMIFNPAGSSLGTDSGIFYNAGGLGDSDILVAPLNIALPPNPVRNYSFDAAASISVELARELVTDSHYTIRIGNLQGVLAPSGPPI